MSHTFAVRLQICKDLKRIVLRVGSTDIALISSINGGTSCEVNLIARPIWRTHDSYEAIGMLLWALDLDPVDFLGGLDEFSKSERRKLVWDLPPCTLNTVIQTGRCHGWPCVHGDMRNALYFTDSDVHCGTWVHAGTLRLYGHTQACQGVWFETHISNQLQVDLLEGMRHTCDTCGASVFLTDVDKDGLVTNLGAGFEAFCDWTTCPMCCPSLPGSSSPSPSLDQSFPM